ncbi:hypothetical protein BGZ99_010250 [Dissophora globulifera]|uniref:Uncharacterized protein n=1 Tax=Dissophora globulifera TaxID=979702 RepID=A0A9P6UYR3_9FUNG|nr:hypothetical protein BGZ99_010250 [Dissophora globulifera]
MVDTVLKSSTDIAGEPLHIDVSHYCRSSFIAGQCRNSTFSLAKYDLSQIDDDVVSQLNWNTILDLFPTPPRLLPKSRSESPTCFGTSESCVASRYPPPFKPRPRSKNRNWVITSGQFMSSPDDDSDQASSPSSTDFSSPHHNKVPLKWELTRDCQVVCQLLDSSRRQVQAPLDPRETDISTPKTTIQHNTSALVSRSSSVPVPTSLVNHVDDISQQILAIETHMQRPSLLKDGQASIPLAVSVMDPATPEAVDYEQNGRSLVEISLKAEHILSPSELSNPEIMPEAGTLQECDGITKQEIDWQAWHEAWRHRRTRLEDDSLSSSLSSGSRTSCSSSDSARLSIDSDISSSSHAAVPTQQPVQSYGTMPTMLSLAEQPHKIQSLQTSPLARSQSTLLSFRPILSTTDTYPNPSESNGHKWGDQLQHLIRSLPFSAGRPSRKPTVIMRKSRWTKRIRTLSTES